jgi:hypothetical protein
MMFLRVGWGYLGIFAINAFAGAFWLSMMSATATTKVLPPESLDEHTESNLFEGYCSPNIVGLKDPHNTQKKVIAMSLFTSVENITRKEFETYMEGFLENSKWAHIYYPDFVIQVYSIGLTIDQIQRLVAMDNVEVIKCQRQGTNAKNMLYRFMAVDHPDTSLALIRGLLWLSLYRILSAALFCDFGHWLIVVNHAFSYKNKPIKLKLSHMNDNGIGQPRQCPHLTLQMCSVQTPTSLPLPIATMVMSKANSDAFGAALNDITDSANVQ